MNPILKKLTHIIRLIPENILYALPLPIKQQLKSVRSFLYQARLYKLHVVRAVRIRPINQERTSPVITVCIPAYQSGPWIEETISSLESQTMQDFHVLISVDGSDADTFEKLRFLQTHPKYTLCLQHKQLGWVGNTNWLLENVKTPFFSILPHDDFIHPFYLKELYRYLLRHPKCLLAYSDIQMVGPDSSLKGRYFTDRSIKGDSLQRMQNYVLRHLNAQGFRGLIRTETLQLSGLIEENPFDHFAADTNWVGKIARYGELHRIPVALYTKRYHSKNTHTQWFHKSQYEQRKAWEAVCQELLDYFLKATDVPSEKEELKRTADLRFQKGCIRFRL